MRKGFTLIELLIIMIIIGILSGVMMMSTPAVMSSGDAVKVVNDMRSIKSAVLEWYADNTDCVVPNSDKIHVVYYTNAARNGTASDRLHLFVKAHPEIIKKYMPNGDIELNEAGNGVYAGKDGYSVVDGSAITGGQNYKKWYVVYYPFTDAGVKKKLAGLAQSAELLGDDNGKIFEANDTYVYMKIMDYGK